MRKYEFYKLDVFTDKPFTGNQLAVFPEASEISENEMQLIANEMNLSETVFVLPSEKALRRLRIFTPKQELPLAGHPVVGTWNLLANLGIVGNNKNGIIKIEQELKVGVLPVEIEFLNNKPAKVTMTQGKFECFKTVNDEAEINRFAGGLGIERDKIINSESLPIQVVSTGVKSIAVPLKNLETLGNCNLNSSLLSDCYLKYDAVGCYVFSFETIEESSKIHTRFFAPADSIPEDAATGSAAGSLSGYLVYYDAIDSNKFIIEQGDFMNRPSRIFAEVEGEKGNVLKVKIGGNSVIVAKGEIYLS